MRWRNIVLPESDGKSCLVLAFPEPIWMQIVVLSYFIRRLHKGAMNRPPSYFIKSIYVLGNSVSLKHDSFWYSLLIVYLFLLFYCACLQELAFVFVRGPLKNETSPPDATRMPKWSQRSSGIFGMRCDLVWFGAIWCFDSNKKSLLRFKIRQNTYVG